MLLAGVGPVEAVRRPAVGDHPPDAGGCYRLGADQALVNRGIAPPPDWTRVVG